MDLHPDRGLLSRDLGPLPSIDSPEGDHGRHSTGPEPYRLYCRGRIFAVRWLETTPRTVDEVASIAERQAERWGELCYISVSGVDARLPSAEAREALTRSVMRLTPCMRRFCLVLEGTGFVGSTLRLVVAGLGLVAPRELQYDVYANIDACTESLARTEPLDPLGLAGMLRVAGIAGVRPG